MPLANELGCSRGIGGTNWNETWPSKGVKPQTLSKQPLLCTSALPRPFTATKAVAMGGCIWARWPVFAGTKDSWCWRDSWAMCPSWSAKGVCPDWDHGVPKEKRVQGPQWPDLSQHTALSMTRFVVEWCRFAFSRNHAGERERFPLIHKVLLSKTGEL